MPKVSVVIPSYNHGKYIRQCLDSVFAQSFSDFEIVITDDGSRDDSLEQIGSYSDPRIDLHAFPENLGACVALNASIRRSRGEYVAVLNSDDYFDPIKLERQVTFLNNHPEIGAVYALPRFVDERGVPIANHPWTEYFRRATNVTRFEWLQRFFFSGNSLCHPSVMIRRECYDRVGLYDPRLAQLPDLDMWIRLCFEFEIHVLPEELVSFRVRDQEMNASGVRPEVGLRSYWENRRMLDHFLGLSRPVFDRIFPEYASAVTGSVNSLICELALQANSCFHSDFALDTLYREMAACDDEKRYRDFVRLTGAVDPYNLQHVGALQAQIANLQQRIQQLESGRKPAPITSSLSHSFTVKPR